MDVSKIIPRKRFGQNFLMDKNILRKMAACIAPQQGQHLVEIGPGLGALTEQILPATENLDVIEIDRDLVAVLEERYANDARIHIHSADALEFDLHKLTQQPHSLRVIGNLPYNISSPLLFKCFENKALIQDMHFLLQKEVVDRITAPLGGADYGRLSVMAQYYCICTDLFSVPPEAFKPRPQVYSSFLRLVPREEPILAAHNTETLSKVVKEAFTYRRKTLSNSLKKLVAKELLIKLDIDPSLRPQDLSVQDFVRISNEVGT